MSNETQTVASTVTIPTDVINLRDVKPFDHGNNSTEERGSRQLRVNSKGVTGTWKAKKLQYAWIKNGVPQPGGTTIPLIGGLLPAYGSSWSPEFLSCRLADITFEEKENGLCEATLSYTSEGFVNALDVSIKDGFETYTVPLQAKWGVNTPAIGANNPWIPEQEFGNPYMNYTVNYKTSFTRSQGFTIANYIASCKNYMQAYKKVNNATWHTFPAESCLCEGVELIPEFDIDGYLISLTFRCDFKIYNDYHSHNMKWKEPVPMPNGKGVEYVWHNIPTEEFPEGAFYTTDPYKVGTKVYRDDVTITNNNDGSITVTPISPQPFHGGWYKPYMEYNNNIVYLYGSCNFTTILGIPDVTAPVVNGGS